MATWRRISTARWRNSRCDSGDVSISFLPLSHVTARHVDFALLYRGVTLAHLSFVNQLAAGAAGSEAHILCCGAAGVRKNTLSNRTEGAGVSPIQRSITGPFRWGKNIGRKSWPVRCPRPGRGGWQTGWCFRKCAPAWAAASEFSFPAGRPWGVNWRSGMPAIGIRIHEGYGLTETSPVIAVNTPRAHKIGTVGKPLPNVEVRIADDGEVLVRGPSVFKQYWNKPKETQEAFVDGWFKTGDIGNLDADGFLSITDRKKDLIKTSGGKFIAPQPIENSLKHNALVAEAVVVGEKRKFPAVLIAPNFPLLEDWAREP